MKRALAIASGLLAACQSGEHRQESVTVLVSNDLLSEDPNRELENVTWSVLSNVYEPLVDFDAELRVRPALAESWEQPAPERWRFRLRRDVVFHDGTPLTAEVVGAALRRVRDSPAHEASQYLSPIQAIEVVDTHILDLVTRVPRALLPNLAVVMVTKPNAAGGFPALVGTGPFALKEWSRGRTVTLEAFPRYAGPAPAFRRALFEPEGDPARRLARLREGSADLTEDVPPAHAIEPVRGVRFVRRPGLTLYYLGLNVRRGSKNPFADARVRRALHLAIDRRELVATLLRGQGRVATQPAPSDVFGFDPALPEPLYDTEAARRLLQEAGWAGGLKARLDVAGDRQDAAQMIASQLSRIGVSLEINAVARDVVYELGSSGKSALYFMGWNFVGGESSDFLEYCLHTPGIRLGLTNYGGYSNARLDLIAEDNPGVLDPLERQKLLFEAARIAMTELPVLPLYVTDDIYAVREGLRYKARAGSALRVADLAPETARP